VTETYSCVMTVYLHMCDWQLYLKHSGDEQTKKKNKDLI